QPDPRGQGAPDLRHDAGRPVQVRDADVQPVARRALLQAPDHLGDRVDPLLAAGRAAGAEPMPSFVWKGRTRAGQSQEGVLLADNRDAAIANLRRQQIQVTNIREKGREVKLVPRFSFKIPPKRISIFTRQFSVMLDAGLPLVQCLEILGGQEESKAFGAIINEVRSDVESGMSIADSMRKHPKAFDNL